MGNSGSLETHRCGLFCLGPLTFHRSAVGSQVSLSRDRTLACRNIGTFKNGMVFSSRSVRVGEAVCLAVIGHVEHWSGALRVGFTNIPPSGRSGPLPPMSIPDLTATAGHWAGAVPEHFCCAGSVLEFWVSHGGTLYYRARNGQKHKLREGVDISRPLWAMLDIYGQTYSLLLLGSKKRGLIRTHKSCPLPANHPSLNMEPPNSLQCDENALCSSKGPIRPNYACDRRKKLTSDTDIVENCVVCMVNQANITLLCGHRCLCLPCAARVFQDFGTCPLCRQAI